MSFSADGLWLHFQWNNTILLLSEQHKCFLLLYTCLSSLINSSLNLCLRLHFFEATVNEFFCYIKKFFSKKKKSPIPKYSTTNIDRVLSSCGFSYWSFFCLFSESLGFYSPLSGCISHSINAFRQIDSKVSEIVKFCDNWSTLSVPCSLSPNLSNAVILFVIVWNTSWVISGTQVSFLYNLHTPSGQRILWDVYHMSKLSGWQMINVFARFAFKSFLSLPIYVEVSNISISSLKIFKQALQSFPVFQFLYIMYTNWLFCEWPMYSFSHPRI